MCSILHCTLVHCHGPATSIIGTEVVLYAEFIFKVVGFPFTLHDYLWEHSVAAAVTMHDGCATGFF